MCCPQRQEPASALDMIDDDLHPPVNNGTFSIYKFTWPETNQTPDCTDDWAPDYLHDNISSRAGGLREFDDEYGSGE